MIKRIDITSAETFAYLKEQLYLSGKTLSNQLMAKSLKEGKVFAYVPENTAFEVLYRFDSGGIYPLDKSLLQNRPALVAVQNDARPVVINYILQYLRQNKRHCCMLEEPVRSPSDPSVNRSAIKYLLIEKEMYYFFGKDVESEKIENAFRTSEGYYFLCALSSLPPQEQNSFSPFSSLSSEQIKDFASNVVSFFVRAYDGEGYLQWSKGSN